jgi:hypothetical protein
MSDFHAEWSQAKKEFEKETGQKKPAPVQKTLFGIDRKSTDIASSLKAVDAALAKKSRNDAVEAFKKFSAAQNEYVNFTNTARKGLDDNAKDNLMVLVARINQLSKKVGAEIEKLREEKGGVKVPSDTFLADFSADRNAFEKGAKASAELEKKWGLLKRSEPMLKALQAYAGFSAKSDYAKAAAALTLFKQEADKFSVHCDLALDMEEKNANAANYVKHVKQFKQFVANLWPSRFKHQKELLEQAAKA